jgi:tRNA/tmRNA/rRNA uracil-C5-methylase (TrmA/RlmC/RlmD family)
MNLDPTKWQGSVLGTECTFHQIAQYIGKMKSSMAREIIETYSSKGDIILDPFAGSGAVGLESSIAGRSVVCTDINPYAITLTRAKLNAPNTSKIAVRKVSEILDSMYDSHIERARFFCSLMLSILLLQVQALAVSPSDYPIVIT